MSTKNCPNCSSILEESFNYCPACGQKDTSKIASVKGLILDFLGDYFTFDSKIFKSVKPLIFVPGFLTIEYIVGKRVSYIPPLRLYLFISIFFFVLFAQLNPTQTVAMEGNSVSQDMFDYFIDQHMHKVLLLLVPIFAGVLYLFYRKKYGNYFIHFIFSLHYHAFLFIALGLYLVITYYFTTNSFELNQWMFLGMQLIFLVYLFFALRKVYQQRIGTTLLKLVIVALFYSFSFLGVSIASFALYYLWWT